MQECAAQKLHGERLGWNDRIPLRLSLQRVAFTLIDRDGGDRSWISTLPLRKGVFSHAVPVQQSWETIVAFDAARLVIDSVFLVALQREFLFGSPRPHPHGRILHCHGIFE